MDIVPTKYIITLSRSRLSAQQIRIETGRYGKQRTERNIPFCTICNSGDIEDKYNFVIICPIYREIRRQYSKIFYYVRSSVFILLMQVDTISVISMSTMHLLYTSLKYM